jgi:hypothetical protein
VLDSTQVLEYAMLDDRVKYSGHSHLLVDGKEVGPVPCMIISRNLSDSAIFLMHCGRDWTVWGVAPYPSVADAKRRAETIYPGVSKCWIDAPTAGQDISELMANYSDENCVFCGKRPDEVDWMVEKDGKFICGLCVAQILSLLQMPDELLRVLRKN